MPGEEIYISMALNREERSSHFEFNYLIFSDSYFFIRGGYAEYKFEHHKFSWRDSYSYQVYSGIRFSLLGKIRGTISLGYKKLIPWIKGKRAFSGFVGNTSLSFRLWRFGFRLSYNRDCHFSYWTNNVFFISDSYGTGISGYLTGFLRVDYNYTYGASRYPEPTRLRLPNGSYEEIKRKDIYPTHSIGFVFRIINNVGIGLIANFWERKSNYYWENRNRKFVGTYITYQF